MPKTDPLGYDAGGRVAVVVGTSIEYGTPTRAYVRVVRSPHDVRATPASYGGQTAWPHTRPPRGSEPRWWWGWRAAPGRQQRLEKVAAADEEDLLRVCFHRLPLVALSASPCRDDPVHWSLPTPYDDCSPPACPVVVRQAWCDAVLAWPRQKTRKGRQYVVARTERWWKVEGVAPHSARTRWKRDEKAVARRSEWRSRWMG